MEVGLWGAGLLFNFQKMSLNIIVKKGGGKVSAGDVVEVLALKIERDVARHKHNYKSRAREARKAAEQITGSKDFRPVAVYDAETLIRHEQENPGSTSDPTWRKEFLRDNPECRLD